MGDILRGGHGDQRCGNVYERRWQRSALLCFEALHSVSFSFSFRNVSDPSSSPAPSRYSFFTEEAIEHLSRPRGDSFIKKNRSCRALLVFFFFFFFFVVVARECRGRSSFDKPRQLHRDGQQYVKVCALGFERQSDANGSRVSTSNGSGRIQG